jgi:hypothetical protein
MQGGTGFVPHNRIETGFNTSSRQVLLCSLANKSHSRGVICQRQRLELHSAMFDTNIAEHTDYARRIQASTGRRHKTDGEKRGKRI